VLALLFIFTIIRRIRKSQKMIFAGIWKTRTDF
jgi:hypothetical protein